MPDNTVEVGKPRTNSSAMDAGAGWEEYTFGPYKRFPERQHLIAEYWLMRTYDPVVKRVLALLRTLICNNAGRYTHPDGRVEETVNSLMARLSGGLDGVMGSMLSALWAGYAVAEKLWATSGSEWWVDRALLLHPVTFFNSMASRPEEKDGIRLDPKSGQVEKLVQYGRQAGSASVEHKRADVLYWPLFPELREQVYGQSVLASARRAWYSKTMMENYWNTFCQKCAMPVPVFLCPDGTVRDPETNQDITIGAFMVKQWQKVEPGSAMSLPMRDGLTPEVITLVPSDGASVSFERNANYWVNQLFDSMLTPRIILEEPEHASRAQTGTVLDLYYMMVAGIMQELGTVLVGQLAAPLIAANVGADVEAGSWKWAPLQTSDLEMLARVFETVERGKSQSLMSGGGLSEADDAKLRETFEVIYAEDGGDTGASGAYDGSETETPVETGVSGAPDRSGLGANRPPDLRSGTGGPAAHGDRAGAGRMARYA
jgi:hypothetical protein